jgi:hypothetical protein
MAKTLITTPFPEPADVGRKLGISPKRQRELIAMLDEIQARSRKRKKSARAASTKKVVKSVSRKRA